MHNHAWSVSKALYTGYDFNQSSAYNDYVTKVSGSTELKIVDEFKADGSTEVNRQEDVQNGTVYVLNQACGFKTTGKEKPLTLTSLAGTKHVNTDNSPWWLSAQSQSNVPTYIDLQISYDEIVVDTYQIKGIVSFDEYKNATICDDLSQIREEKFHTFKIIGQDRNTRRIEMDNKSEYNPSGA